MKKPEIARGMARQWGVSEGEAADRLDRVIHQIMMKLRRGVDAPLPGLGRLRRGRDGKVTFERERGAGRE